MRERSAISYQPSARQGKIANRVGTVDLAMANGFGFSPPLLKADC
jgi:hypothetical protein